MKKWSTPLAIFVGVGLFIFAFVYFVGGITRVAPPIREYHFDGSVGQLAAGFQRLAGKDTAIHFEITDTTGTEGNYAIYMQIISNAPHGNMEYSIKCKEEEKDQTSNLHIGLVEAIDLTRMLGGYWKKAKGVDLVANEFESKILTRLRAEQHINIVKEE